jgi:hypothetical protein
MEANLAQRRAGLDEKIPDIKKTLDMVKVLSQRRVSSLPSCPRSQLMGCISQGGKQKAKDDELGDEDDADKDEQPLKTTFELNDTLYAEAEVEESDVVYLWLGVRLSSTSPHTAGIHF